MNEICYAIATDNNWTDKDGKMHSCTGYVANYPSGISSFAAIHCAETFSSIKTAKNYFKRNKKEILNGHSSYQISHPRIVRIKVVQDYTSLLF